MRWHVNPHSGVPLYVQIEEQIKTAIASGVLEVGERLPTVRELALELTINPNTVARAYRELERAGHRLRRQARSSERQGAALSEQERRRRLSSIVARRRRKPAGVPGRRDRSGRAGKLRLARHQEDHIERRVQPGEGKAAGSDGDKRDGRARGSGHL